MHKVCPITPVFRPGRSPVWEGALFFCPGFVHPAGERPSPFGQSAEAAPAAAKALAGDAVFYYNKVKKRKVESSMELIVRTVTPAELDKAVEVEEAAMKGGGYLRDVSPLFLGDTVGPLLGAYRDGELVGIAKYTVLPDHTAWLETLRVTPAHQRQGVGRRLYEEFQALSKEKGVESMAMYTGLKNIPSYSLARVFGLDTAGRYREMQLDLDGVAKPEKPAFAPVGEDRAVELVLPLSEKYEGFVIFNRTFMRINEANVRALAREGKVLEDPATGSVLVFGNRFLEKRSVQIAMMDGDADACIDYAIAVGLEKGVPAVVTETPLDAEALQAQFAARGFKATAELQVMSGPAC